MVGKFSELKSQGRDSGVGVGVTSFDPNTDTAPNTRNEVITVNTGIGKRHDPNPFYIRKSEVKSAGGYSE